MNNNLLGYCSIFQKRPIWFSRLVISRILLYSGLSRWFTIRLGNARLKFFPTKFSADLWFPAKNIFEDFKLPFLKHGDTVIDVGANIGVTVLLFEQYIGQGGRVHAFEPNPMIFQYLKENIAMNRVHNVQFYDCALGEKAEQVYLQDNNVADTGNAITLEQDNSFMVRMERLDDVLKESGIEMVHLLKVDTEGYEKFVFDGAKETLSKTNFIIFEAIEHNCQRFGYSTRDLADFLCGEGFHVFCYDMDSEVYEPFDSYRYIHSGRRFSYDLFAVRSQKQLTGVRWS